VKSSAIADINRYAFFLYPSDNWTPFQLSAFTALHGTKEGKVTCVVEEDIEVLHSDDGEMPT